MPDPASPSAASPSDASPRAARLALGALVLGAAAIAFAPIFVRLSDVGPVAIGFWRVTLAAPALLLWFLLERRPAGADLRRGDVRMLAAAGACFAGDLAVWHLSIAFTSVANATLLANVSPIFVALVSWLVFGQRFTRLYVAGVVVAFVGVGILMGRSVEVGPTHLLGDALGLLTAVFYGSYFLIVARLRARLSTATIMLASAVGTAVILLPIALLAGERILPGDARGWAVLAALGLFSHAGGQSLIAFALAHLPATFSALALLFQPIFAAALAWILLGEPLGPVEIAGAVVILVGIVLARRGSTG
jgi:drug/metabolite transporter (DMT)-like permease